ncbi:MAG TPA: OmpA family protein [Fulvivirga sp.]|nr:OmpA family protein [Fulvivirga sp.]
MNSVLKIISGLLLCMLFATYQSNAQEKDNVKSYAIIGAFSSESNAKQLATDYAEQSLNTKVRKNNFNNMFYVYTFESDNVEEAREAVLKIRDQFEALPHAWLYNGNFNCLHIPSDQLVKKQTIENKEPIAENEPKNIAMEEVKPQPIAIEKPKAEKPDNIYWIYVNAYNITNQNEIEGNVKVIDVERNKEIGTEKANQLIELKDPKNGTNRIKITSDVFGYQILSRTLDLDEPLTSETKGYVTLVGDSIILDFPLSRFRNGDFMTMYNVYFYIDAAIMREESIYELNQLLDMMREDESIRIKIHGHTNGNSRGPVKHLDLDDKMFFNLNGSHLEETASAKKLSLYRAYTIKHWLMDQGIDEGRMEIIGWGGKKMIYDKNSTNADKNVRVEIEIL